VAASVTGKATLDVAGASGTALGEDDENMSMLREDLSNEVAYKSLPRSLELREEDASKRNLQAASYLVLVEDRLREMEARIKELEAKGQEEVPPTKEKADPDPPAPSGPSGLILEPVVMGWKEWVAPTPEEQKKPLAALEVLMEAPYSLESSAK
jgi:hypothetical protein